MSSPHIVHTSDSTFSQDVLKSDKPVLLDFWAEWCGPCKAIGPILEKLEVAYGGAFKLAKINSDEEQQLAAAFGIRSIPTVVLMKNGQPVDGFMGALPDSQVKAFIDKLAGPGAPSDVDQLLAMAKESLEVGDIGGAAQAYAQALQAEPDNLTAIGGLARCYLDGGDIEHAREVAEMAPADARNADLDSVRAALKLAEAAPSETAEFEHRLAANPDDHEARLEYAKALAGRGDLQAAADQLLMIIERDRAWSDEAARKQLLTVFEAAGMASDVAKQGRRRLSAILFS